MANPQPASGSPTVPAPGLKGPRGAILVELKRAGQRTAKELGLRLGVSLNAVRHHLKELEAEGLVGYERRAQGVGAPVFAYGLTPAGEALFPRRYEQTLTQVLDAVAARQGREAAVAVLEARYDELAARLAPVLKDLGPAERLAVVASALADEGYMAESAMAEAGTGTAQGHDTLDGTLVQRNCTIPSVAQRYPEICAAERRFLERLLGAEVERESHMLQGCSACAYRVRFRGVPADAAKPLETE